MEKQQIEDRDRELVEKFRAIVRNKEKKSGSGGQVAVWIALAAVLGISGWWFFSPPATGPGAETPGIDQAAPASASVMQATADTGSMETDTPTDPKTDTPSEALPVAPAVDDSTQTAAPVSLQNRPVQDRKTSVKQATRKKSSDLRIEQILSCSSVQNRECGSAETQFSMARDAAASVWMKVISENPPFKLTHVYYCNDVKYCEVPLQIRHPRTRTWSSIGLNRQEQIGRWRVEVVREDGIKLAGIEFMVVP